MFTSFTDVPASLQSESAFVAHWLATRQNVPGVRMFVYFFFAFFFHRALFFVHLRAFFLQTSIVVWSEHFKR